MTPNNPTSAGWSASKIREYQWKPSDILFTYLDSVEGTLVVYVNECIEALNTNETAIATEKARAEAKEAALQSNINAETTRAKGKETELKSYTDTSVATEKARAVAEENKVANNLASETNRAKNIESDLDARVSNVESKIPNQASATNQLADKEYVDNAVSTVGASFRGTVESTYALQSLQGDINDYAFLIVTDQATGTKRYDRYVYNEEKSSTTGNWKFEYTLNNSGFTDSQWGSINSGVTDGLVKQITTNEDDITKLKNKQIDSALSSTSENAIQNKAVVAGISATDVVNSKSYVPTLEARSDGLYLVFKTV